MPATPRTIRVRVGAALATIAVAAGATAVITITGDDGPRLAFVKAPASGTTVAGLVSVTAKCRASGACSAIRFKVDGTDLGVWNTKAPFTVTWDSLAIANGPHVLTAVAVHSNGRTEEDTLPVEVTVANPVVPPPVSEPAELFIAPTGDDSGPCSNAAPCQSLNGAAGKAGGDSAVTVGVRGGTYGAQAITASGHAPIVFRPVAGASPTFERVVVQSSNVELRSLVVTGAVSVADTSIGPCADGKVADVTLRDVIASYFELLGPVTRPSVIGGSYGPSVDAHARVSSYNGGAGWHAPCDALMDGGTIHDVATSGRAGVHTECFQTYGYPTNFTIRNWRFWNCPVDLPGVPSTVTGFLNLSSVDGLTFLHNTVGGVGSGGIAIDFSTTNARFEGNVSDRPFIFGNTYASCWREPAARCGPYEFIDNVGGLTYSSCAERASGTYGYTTVYRGNRWISDGGGGTSLCPGHVGDKLFPAGTPVTAVG